MATEFKFASGRARAERERARAQQKAEWERQREANRERDRRRQQEDSDRWWQRYQQRQSGSTSSNGYIPQADKAMALEVINSGLRALTRKHHPDLGGNHEDMVAVNRAVEALRKLVS